LHFEFLVGQSASFPQVIKKIPLLSQANAAVLLLGETGTGKELVALAIHAHSARQHPYFSSKGTLTAAGNRVSRATSMRQESRTWSGRFSPGSCDVSHGVFQGLMGRVCGMQAAPVSLHSESIVTCDACARSLKAQSAWYQQEWMRQQ
jgi:hypothetical protein